MDALTLSMSDVSTQLDSCAYRAFSSDGCLVLTESNQTAGVYEMPRRFDAFINRYEEIRSEERSNIGMLVA